MSPSAGGLLELQVAGENLSDQIKCAQLWYNFVWNVPKKDTWNKNIVKVLE